MVKQQMTLKNYMQRIVREYEGIRPAARALYVNPGVVHYVLNGGDSPMLRKQLGIPKHPPRSRLVIDCPPSLRARFDAARGDSTRREYLERLLDSTAGVGELDY